LKDPIGHLEVSYFLHATEDRQRVMASISSKFSFKGVPEVDELEGHWGNPIAKVTFRLSEEDGSGVFDGIIRSLGEKTRKEIIRNLGLTVDEHSTLYLRFDKQALVSGTFALGVADPVRIKVRPRGFVARGGGVKFYSDILSEVR
jgi:RNA binding exosome subunit